MYQYGGTADLLLKKGSDYILVDFKTSKKVYPDYVVQGAAYKQLIEEKYDYKINKFIVARFGKETDDFETKESNLEQLDHAFEYFKTLRKAFDQDKQLNKILRSKK
jgi:predicted RecB family nuclease